MRDTKLAQVNNACSTSLLLLMCQSTARRIGARDVDGRIALFDVRDLPLHIDHEGGPVGHAVLRNQDAV